MTLFIYFFGTKRQMPRDAIVLLSFKTWVQGFPFSPTHPRTLNSCLQVSFCNTQCLTAITSSKQEVVIQDVINLVQLDTFLPSGL